MSKAVKVLRRDQTIRTVRTVNSVNGQDFKRFETTWKLPRPGIQAPIDTN